MAFSLLSPVFRLRPVIYITGAASAAVTSYFLLHRWFNQEQVRTDDLLSDHLEELVTELEESDQLRTGPLVVYRKLCDYVQRTNQMYAHTITQLFFCGDKQVEVTLQHKSVHNGLESEHWWVLTNVAHQLFPEESGLPPMYVGTVKVVACIKRVGHHISEVNAHIRKELTSTSVLPTQMLQTKLCKIYKGVTIGEDGCYRFSESSDTHVLETPLIIQPAARPAGPPPGFK